MMVPAMEVMMTLLINDIPIILQNLIGKTARQCRGLVVEGSVPNDHHHPLFRIDGVYFNNPDDDSDHQDIPMDFSDGEKYVFVRITTMGTRESPLRPPTTGDVRQGAERGETWEMWFVAYGNAPDQWNMHIPRRAEPGAPKRYNEMVYPAIKTSKLN